MTAKHKTIEDLVRSRQPQFPVYCVYPHVYHDTARHFVGRFPGRVLYAVKANDHPAAIPALQRGGVTHFGCAPLPEIVLVGRTCPTANCYVMNRFESTGMPGTRRKATVCVISWSITSAAWIRFCGRSMP